MDGVVQEVNARVLEKWLELLRANYGRFKIKQLLFANDTAKVADSEKLCRQVKIIKNSTSAYAFGLFPGRLSIVFVIKGSPAWVPIAYCSVRCWVHHK